MRAMEASAVNAFALEREMAALNSLLSLGSSAELEKQISSASALVKSTSAQAADWVLPDRRLLAPPFVPELLRIPVRNPNLTQYFHQVDDIKKVNGLSSLMSYEALNFADGKVDATVGGEVDSPRPVERKPKRSYIAPQPGLFDETEE